MMASQGYRDWLAAGQPYTLIRPARALQRNLRAHGLTVYDYPDDAHLLASTPEDHTPFSVTGWPGTNRRWNARALDVMPRSDSAAHRKENADIARQLIRDRNAGLPGVMWIKYLNWTDESGVCRQERWMPDHATRSSTDKGHIHISGRSDVDDDARAEDYDPIARMNGDDDMTPEQEALLKRVERILTAGCTVLGDEAGAGESPDREGIVLDPPWPNGPTVVPNPVAQLKREIAELKAALGEPRPVEVTVSDAQLPQLADLVVERLRELRFVGTPPAGG